MTLLTLFTKTWRSRIQIKTVWFSRHLLHPYYGIHGCLFYHHLGAIAACVAASCRRRCWWSFQARCSRKAALFRRSWSDCGAGNAMGFWGHGIFWGFLKAAKKRMRGKTLGVYIILENNSVIILYSVIWCCMVNCQRRVLATLRCTSRNHFCIRFTQHIRGATSS